MQSRHACVSLMQSVSSEFSYFSLLVIRVSLGRSLSCRDNCINNNKMVDSPLRFMINLSRLTATAGKLQSTCHKAPATNSSSGNPDVQPLTPK